MYTFLALLLRMLLSHALLSLSFLSQAFSIPCCLMISGWSPMFLSMLRLLQELKGINSYKFLLVLLSRDIKIHLFIASIKKKFIDFHYQRGSSQIHVWGWLLKCLPQVTFPDSHKLCPSPPYSSLVMQGTWEELAFSITLMTQNSRKKCSKCLLYLFYYFFLLCTKYGFSPFCRLLLSCNK